MTASLRIGMIGLDTSHVTAFAAILNDREHAYHVPGGKITVAYPGEPSPDFELSWGRVEKYTHELKQNWGIPIVDSAEAVAEACDAIMILSVDGRVHADVFKRVAPYGKPVFIDKPFTASLEDARQIAETARQYKVAIMSCSALRYAEALTQVLTNEENGSIIGADCFGPMSLQPALPGWFWYGIHTVEMLYRIMGQGCESVTVETNTDYDLVTGIWKDGRMGSIRGSRKGHYNYGAILHRDKGASFADISAHPKPIYVGMLERIMHMFQTGQPGIDMNETLEIVSFIECVNESKLSGSKVLLK